MMFVGVILLMKNLKFHTYIFVIATLFCSCCGKSVKTVENIHNFGGAIWTSKDSWYAPSPDSYGSHDVLIPRNQFHELDSLHAAIGVKMLEGVPIIPLTRKQSADFGVTLTTGDSLKPYLVRALSLEKGTGGYEPSSTGDTLLILHGSLGRGPGEMHRNCLIVELKTEPHVVYVEVSLAE